MVGEIRDSETADIAIKASLTGQVVLSTLHTNDAVGAITRLIDMGIEPFLVASSLDRNVRQTPLPAYLPALQGAHRYPQGNMKKLGLDRVIKPVTRRRFLKARAVKHAIIPVISSVSGSTSLDD
jgi:type II secretory ATPase GspE/PulE/Tfp pilus assembly ATPase PilB-like protein